MKNVKAILIGVALCATVFANARIEALGGDAGFWPGDRANATAFPHTLNDGQWVEFGNVDGDPTGSVDWSHDGANWGFNFDSAGNDDWMNMSWAKDGMGLSVGFMSSAFSAVDANIDDDGLCLPDADGVSTCDPTAADYLADYGSEVTGFDLAWGKEMSFGELGVRYTTSTATAHPDDATAEDVSVSDLIVNWRGSCGFWVFDNAKAMFWMGDDDMALTYDLFTHVKPTEAVTALVAMGFEYRTTDAGEGTQLWLPNATVAVEADLADWATFRGFVS
ncbi:MAG: hypothetical protein CMG66_03635, partial [Candidatus Marinimicrobia bacterium]|nr:hypothetical protein [Candidatus Neomarinimicrobiota bacterium]